MSLYREPVCLLIREPVSLSYGSRCLLIREPVSLSSKGAGVSY